MNNFGNAFFSKNSQIYWKYLFSFLMVEYEMIEQLNKKLNAIDQPFDVPLQCPIHHCSDIS